MYIADVSIKLNGFKGDSFDALSELQDNFIDHKSILLRGLPDQSTVKVSLTQIANDIFKSQISVLTDEASLSEDMVLGQIESNIISMKDRGILSINLHDWDLSLAELNVIRN
jgi:23S rRNA maturation-related 3'-5' exoribonuclease YhaM